MKSSAAKRLRDDVLFAQQLGVHVWRVNCFFSPLVWGIHQATVPCAGGLQGWESQRLLSEQILLVLLWFEVRNRENPGRVKSQKNMGCSLATSCGGITGKQLQATVNTCYWCIRQAAQSCQPGWFEWAFSTMSESLVLCGWPILGWPLARAAGYHRYSPDSLVILTYMLLKHTASWKSGNPGGFLHQHCKYNSTTEMTYLLDFPATHVSLPLFGQYKTQRCKL